MKTAKLFMNGKSQAVRLPKEFRFHNVDKLYIRRVGDEIILSPKKMGWDDVFNALDGFTDDFMSERQQPAPQEREDIF